MRSRQHSWRNGRYVFGPPSSSTLDLSVLPRVKTARFWLTIASASEFMISLRGMPDLTRLTMSVSANTPHLAATWCSLVGSNLSLGTSSRGMPTFSTHLSIVAGLEAHMEVRHE